MEEEKIKRRNEWAKGQWGLEFESERLRERKRLREQD